MERPSDSSGSLPLGPGHAYLYDIATDTFITDIVYPGSLSNTANGIYKFFTATATDPSKNTSEFSNVTQDDLSPGTHWPAAGRHGAWSRRGVRWMP